MNEQVAPVHSYSRAFSASIRVSDASTASSWHASIERCGNRPIFLLIYSSPLKSLLKGEISVHIAVHKSTSKNLHDEMSCWTFPSRLPCLFYDTELFKLQ